MRLFHTLFVLPLALILAILPARAFAQQTHVVEPRAVADAVGQHVAAQAADRAAIHDALTRPEVRDMAGRIGLDLGRANAAVDTMSGADLDRAASAARQVNDTLVGGSTVVISTTTIILILLLVILIVVVAR